MAICHEPQPEGKRSFIVVAYAATPAGKLGPVSMPNRCLEDDGDVDLAKPCHIVVSHWRPRSTGPCFPLCVATCETHGQAFTLYPPSHVPYGRFGVAPIALDGETLVHAPDGDPPEPEIAHATAGPQASWETTFLAAACDATRGKPWSREHGPLWWQTQRRRIVVGAKLFGIDTGLADASRDVRAGELEIAALVLRDEARDWSQAKGYRSRGAVVTSAMRGLPRGRCVLDRVLVAGALAGLWGRPYRWEPQQERLRDLLAERQRPP
jgi:hypothetical protein